MEARDDNLERELRRARSVALEDAARQVERFRMPKAGDGPVILLDVILEMARQIRAMKR